MRLRWQPLVLVAVGLAIGSLGDRPADAGGKCQKDQCSFEKPNFLFVLEYSSAMNADFMGQTRWQAAIDFISGVLILQNGYFDDNAHFALLRYGHDPDPANPGTTIPGDASGLVDGVALDWPWYDPTDAPDFTYYECSGNSLVDALAAIDPPLCNGNPCTGIASWTSGGLYAARDLIVQSRADHPDDAQLMGPDRVYANLLITTGEWTDADGTGMDPLEHPAVAAGELYIDHDVVTYVVALGAGATTDIATAGGSGAPYPAEDPMPLYDTLHTLLQQIVNQDWLPECTQGLLRTMIILDASSSMLNVPDAMGQPIAGSIGETPWDRARALLAGMTSVLDASVLGWAALEDMTHVGTIVFGSAGEERLLAQYAPCMKDNLAWALDPTTSCAVGCGDPWGGPPIAWTFVGPGDAAYPGLDADTSSHMPACDVGLPGACSGSGAYLHLGLELAHDNQIAYVANPPPLHPVDSNTPFVNILVTDGFHDSTQAQLAAPLTAMHADGITTYVLGVGDPVDQGQLDELACWGSGGTGIPCVGGTIAAFAEIDQAALEQTLVAIVEQLNFDPCCNFNDCSYTPEPTTNEPDPVPLPLESSGGGASETTSSTTSTTEDAGASDSSTGFSTSGVVSGSESEASTAGGSSATSVTMTTGGVTTSTTAGEGTGAGTGEGSSEGGALSRDTGCGCREPGYGASSVWLVALALLRRRRRA